MKFKKAQLDFLKVFQHCSDTSSFEGDKLTIVTSKETEQVYFTLFTEDIKLIESLPFVVEEDFVLSITLSQFNSMLSFCKDDDIIDMEKGKIKFGNSSEYLFETFDFNIDNFKDILSLTTQEGTVTSLKDISKSEYVSFAMGDDSDTGCIAYQDNYFLTYNGDVLSYIKSGNAIDHNFFLPRIFYKLYQLYKFDSIDLKNIEDSYFYLTIGTMKIFMRIATYAIPYIFDEGIKAKFDHTKKVQFDKTLMKQALSRLKVLNQKTTYNRVFITFQDGTLQLEIKDDYKGQETIKTSYLDESLKDFFIICNTNLLFDIVNNFDNEIITMKLENSENLTTIKLENEGKDTHYVLTLYKKYQDEED